jgi:hypothetical protein
MRTTIKQRQRGVAALEFALSLSFLTPLLIGTYAFGFRLVQAQQLFEITRDLAHMYSRGFDPTTSGAVTEAQDIAGTLGLTSSGNSVVVFSEIQIETAAGCQSATGHSTCTNLNQPVFVQQVAIGNSGTYHSPFGVPMANGTLPGTSGVTNSYSTTVSASDQASSAWAVASTFNNALTMSSGQTAYMVEMITNTGVTVTGLTGSPQVYARAIF